MEKETRDIQELIVVKDGKVDVVPVTSRTVRTYKIGASKRTGTRYRSLLCLGDVNVICGKGGGAYIIGYDVGECVQKYNEYMEMQIKTHKKTIDNLQSLILKEVCCNG